MPELVENVISLLKSLQNPVSLVMVWHSFVKANVKRELFDFDINSTRSNKLSSLSLIDCASLCLRRKAKNVKGRYLAFDFTGRLKL